jgi:polysaccharide deacetylase 2 family uncharacterized protein YibQ
MAFEVRRLPGAGLRLVRQGAGRLRPPALAGVAFGAALIGLIVWLEIASSTEQAAEDGGYTVPIGPAPAAEDYPAGAHEQPATHDRGTTPADDHGAAEASPASHDESRTPVAEAAGQGEAHGSDSGAAGHQAAAEAAPTITLAAVDPELIQASSRGPLPIIGPDDRRPWQVYAGPFPAEDERPRVGLIVMNLGLNRATVEAAMKLPAEVTLSFSPYAPELEDQVAAARAAGHEVMLDLALEPVSYPADDPAPHTLLTSLNPAENIERLEFVLARASGYVGLIGTVGSRFTTAPDALQPVLSVLAERGLMFVDDRSSPDSLSGEIAQQLKLPHAISRGFIDRAATRAEIDERLAALAAEAAEGGAVALAIGRPFPVTLQRIEAWYATLKERGIALAPASALIARADRPKHRPAAERDDASHASEDDEATAHGAREQPEKAGDHQARGARH